MINIRLLPLFLIIIFMIVWILYKVRTGKVSTLKIFVPIMSIVLIAFVSFYIYNSNRMPIILKTSRAYIMDVDETKNSNGTEIKVKKAFLDLNNINVTYSVRGREEVVAIEVKKNPDDKKPLGQCAGMWVGNSLIPENSFIGFSYSSDYFIDPVYLVFYLSNGEEVPFKIQDRVNVKDNVRIININETIDYEGSYMKLLSFYKGLNYSSINFESNFSPGKDVIDVKLIIDGTELQRGTSGFGGGSRGYEGTFSFDPADGENAEIRIINKALNKEDIFHIKLR